MPAEIVSLFNKENGIDRLQNIEEIIGTASDDLFYLDGSVSKIDAGDGIDEVSFELSSTGVSIQFFDNGNEHTIKVLSAESVIGSDHDDIFYFADNVDSYYNGMDGWDIIDFSHSSRGINIGYSGYFPDNHGNYFMGFEEIRGTAFFDVVRNWSSGTLSIDKTDDDLFVVKHLQEGGTFTNIEGFSGYEGDFIIGGKSAQDIIWSLPDPIDYLWGGGSPTREEDEPDYGFNLVGPIFLKNNQTVEILDPVGDGYAYLVQLSAQGNFIDLSWHYIGDIDNENAFVFWGYGSSADETFQGDRNGPDNFDDIFYGGGGNDTFVGGKGNNDIYAGTGDDIFVFELGDGIHTIHEQGGEDTLRIKGGLTPADLNYSQVGNDLVITIASGFRIVGQFSGDASKIVEWVSFDDGTIIALPYLPIEPMNNAPIAYDDIFEGLQGQAISGNVLVDNGLGADNDIDGDALSVIPEDILTAMGSSVLLLANGDFVYSGAIGYTGPDSFEYTVIDNKGGQTVGTVYINILPIPNNDPIAKDDYFSTEQGSLLSGNFLADNTNGIDYDPDGDGLFVVAGTFVTSGGGIVFVLENGDFTYTPPTDFIGHDSFEYILRDNRGGSTTGTALFAISAAPNAAPVAQDDLFAAPQDTDIEGNLLTNNGHGPDYDPDGDVLSVVQEIIASSAGGSVIIMANGDFTYMPPAGFIGQDSFNYIVLDNRGGAATGTVILTLTPSIPQNSPPQTQDDQASTKIIQSVTGNVLNNDYDPDGDPLTVQPAAILTAAGGLVTIQEDGHFVYVPHSGFIGMDSFDYTVIDGRGATATGRVQIGVTPQGHEIIGTDGRNELNGTSKNDKIIGHGGDDTLYGHDGNDLLIGGTGSDVLYGGNGNDILIGGDVYIYQSLFNSENVIFPSLIETKNIAHLKPPGTDALGLLPGDLSSIGPQAATISFIGTGAGYDNSLGTYVVAADGTIQGVNMLFANVKDHAPGTAMDIMLPGMPDSNFGFFIIADGARINQGYRTIDIEHGELNFWYNFGLSDQRIANISDNGNAISLVFTDTEGSTVLKGSIYHTTEREGDTSLNPDGQIHVVAGFSTEDANVLRIGFEDLPNLGDADYNDVVFDLSFKPQFALADTNDGDDTLYGGNGNDLLIGGHGNNTLYGGNGADTFLFLKGKTGVDTIKDFNAKEGDRIDIKDILADEFDPVSDMISQFLKIETQGNDALLSIKPDGSSNNFTSLVIIEGGHDLTLEALVQNSGLVF